LDIETTAKVAAVEGGFGSIDFECRLFAVELCADLVGGGNACVGEPAVAVAACAGGT